MSSRKMLLVQELLLVACLILAWLLVKRKKFCIIFAESKRLAVRLLAKALNQIWD